MPATASFTGSSLSGSTFYSIDADSSVSTLLRGLNDAGVLVGSTNSSTQPDQAFMSENGNTTFIVIPGATSSLDLTLMPTEKWTASTPMASE
jgi:hypothetical protein